MRRREFIAGVAGAATWPLALQARQTALPIVGYLGSGSPDDQVYLVDAVLLGLKEAGTLRARTSGLNIVGPRDTTTDCRHLRKS